MPKPTIEARLLTPPALDFTAENLTQTLQAGNPADRHLVVYEDDDDTRIAPIPGRPDLLMRWVDVGYLMWAPPGDPRVGKVDPRNEHLKPADRHIEVFEAELARLSSARDKYGFGVRVPTHATFLVPNDPYDKHGADVFYTVVERLTDTESIPGGGIMDGDYRLKRWHREYKASLAIMGILTTYYLGETTTGFYLGDVYSTQCNASGELMDLDPWITPETGKVQILHNLHEDVAAMQVSIEQHELRERLSGIVSALPSQAENCT